MQTNSLLGSAIGSVFALAFLFQAHAGDTLSYETIFDPDRLLRVEITMDPDDWNELRSQNRSMLEGLAKDRHPDTTESPFTYFKGTAKVNGNEIKNVGIRKKGFVGSLDRTRPSLKLHFKKFEKGRMIAGLEKLTLNNNKQDRSAISQVFAYKVFRDAGLVAPQANHAIVTVNGENLGIYSNVESIDDEFIKRHFKGELGRLYEGTAVDFAPGWADKFETKWGKKEDYSDIEKVIQATQVDDEKLLVELGSVIDLEHFYRFWAVEALLQHWDGYTGGRNNYFIYRTKDSNQFVFIPWGADSIATKHPFWQFTPPKSVYAASIVSRRLYDHPESRERYRRELRDVLDTVWNEEKLMTEIDRIEKLVGKDMPEYVSMQSSATRFKEFIKDRRGSILAELDGDAPEWSWPLEPPAYVIEKGTATGTFNGKWGTLLGNPFGGSGTSMNLQIGDDSPPGFAMIGTSAGISQQPENKGDSTIRIMARSEGSPKLSMIIFSTNPRDFHTGEMHVGFGQMDGVALEIDTSNGGFELLGLLHGTINLDSASKEQNGEVSGSFDTKIIWFNGME